MSKQGKLPVLTAGFILAAGTSAIGLFIPRHDSLLLALAWVTASLGYFWFCRFAPDFRYILVLGLICRFFLFFGLPSLSDDLYRFLWDGYLLKEGISPFAHLPEYYINSGSQIAGLTSELYQKLNSPHYFSVYPPFNQFIFWLSVQLSNSWLAGANLIRGLLLAADIGSFILLRWLLILKKINPSLTNWYFMNPLVILEFTGNLHFEGLVIFFLLLGLYTLQLKKPALSGLGFGMAIATKLLPLIYLPALLLSTKTRQGVLICSISVLLACLTLLPMLDRDLFLGLKSSLGLYIHKFEFNGSIYFLLREVGYWVVGYNAIWILGPFLSIATFILIMWLALFANKQKWPTEKTMLFSLSIYLLLATTVHPWYILPLVVLGLLSGFYFPIVWSLMIFVTYFGYTEAGYELSAFWIVFEYMVVGGTMIFELINTPRYHEEST